MVNINSSDKQTVFVRSLRAEELNSNALLQYYAHCPVPFQCLQFAHLFIIFSILFLDMEESGSYRMSF